MQKSKKLALFVLIIAVVVITAMLYVSNRFIFISEYKIKYEKLPNTFDGYKIVLLSDLHSSEFGKGNKAILKKVRRIDPDMIVMTGDMVNSTDRDFSIFLDLAKSLAASYDVYFIAGNHEQSLSPADRSYIYYELGRMRVQVLDNEKVSVARGEERLDLYGLWINMRYYSSRNNEYVKENAETYYLSTDRIEKLLGKNDGQEFSLLLTHNPLYAESYIKWGADLTLCGHVHGGMIRLPFVGGIYSPERTFFPEYDGGLYPFGEQNLVVSRGIGNGNFGFRFLNCPEIVTIELYK